MALLDNSGLATVHYWVSVLQWRHTGASVPAVQYTSGG